MASVPLWADADLADARVLYRPRQRRAGGTIWLGVFGDRSLMHPLGNERTAPPILDVVGALAAVPSTRCRIDQDARRLCWRSLTCLYTRNTAHASLSWFFHPPGLLHWIEVAATIFAQARGAVWVVHTTACSQHAAVIIVVTQPWLVARKFLLAQLADHPLGVQRDRHIFHGGVTLALSALPQWFAGLWSHYRGGAVELLAGTHPLSSHQRMNMSPTPFVNTYGALAWITEQTAGKHTNSRASLRSAPVGPHHLRLTGSWFAAIHWLRTTVDDAILNRLLRNDPATLKLLRHNLSRNSPGMRAQLYQYRFTSPWPSWHDRAWYTAH